MLGIGEQVDRDVEHLGDPFEHRQAEQGSLAALDLVHPAWRPTTEVSELLAGQATSLPPPCYLSADVQASGRIVVCHVCLLIVSGKLPL
jgi:hypothetical protein